METNNQRLTGEICLITGASRGIGREIAKVLGTHGAQIVGTATTENGAEGITSFLKSIGASGHGMRLDVNEDGAIESLIKEMNATIGAPSVVVNNAGVTRDNLMVRLKDDDWETIMDTNLRSAFRLSRAVLRGMMKARHGRIINITSIVGVTGNPGQTNYAAAKAGMIGLTRSLAAEVAARGITVNAVAPGFIDTDMTRALNDDQKEGLLSKIPAGRLGDAEEVANAVLFLASADAAYITGQTIHVNGGMYMG